MAEVYGNGDYAVLLLNGREIDRKKLKKFKTLFEFRYESGSLTARVFDKNNQMSAENTLVTAGNETVLTVRCDKEKIKTGRAPVVCSDESLQEIAKYHPKVLRDFWDYPVYMLRLR